MKKSIIAAGAASVALAAMPIVGVFAADGTVNTTTVDTMTMNVQAGCNITTLQADRADTVAAFGTVSPGQTATDGTTAFNISCNDAWKVTPTITTALGNGTVTIASGATALDGNVSEWALQLGVTEGATGVTNAFSSYAAVNGTSTISGTAASIASGLTLTPSYKVSVAPGQASGNYSGEVTYTIALNTGA